MPTDGVVEFDVEIRHDRTIVTVDGRRDVAVVVRSADGERIYLPPEDAVGTSPESGGASPYRSGNPGHERPATSPYDSAATASDSAGPPEGRRIVHPEPATDVRLLR